MRFGNLALLLCIALIAASQTPITISSGANGTARPIAGLIGKMRRSDGLRVTYEDPRYGRRSDMDTRPFAFSYGPEDLGTPDGIQATIARMLTEYGASGGVTFRVIKDGTRLNIVPAETGATTAQRVHQDSVLETNITIPSAQRDGLQLLRAICDEVRRQTGYAIGIGPSAPVNSLARFHTAEGIEAQTARAALEHLLDGIMLPGSAVWDLYYDPADRGYGLNFAYVGPAGIKHGSQARTQP